MRISTSMIFDQGVRAMNSQTATALHTQQQISANTRILKPSDDPVAAARVLEVTQSRDVTAQFTKNQANANSALGLEDAQLSSANDLLTRVNELAIQAGSSTLNASDRKTIATELRTRFDELVGIANATDGNGQYLFAGYMGSTEPFVTNLDSMIADPTLDALYQGDGGQRNIQVSSSRQIAVSDSGLDIFVKVPQASGSGTKSVFRSMADLIGTLEGSLTGVGLATAVSDAKGNLTKASDNLLVFRTGIGTRMQELDSMGSLNSSLDIQYQQTLSNLQDLDYAKAITDLTRQQTNLQAAQLSFTKINQLSLFDYIR